MTGLGPILVGLASLGRRNGTNALLSYLPIAISHLPYYKYSFDNHTN